MRLKLELECVELCAVELLTQCECLLLAPDEEGMSVACTRDHHRRDVTRERDVGVIEQRHREADAKTLAEHDEGCTLNGGAGERRHDERRYVTGEANDTRCAATSDEVTPSPHDERDEHPEHRTAFVQYERRGKLVGTRVTEADLQERLRGAEEEPRRDD